MRQNEEHLEVEKVISFIDCPTVVRNCMINWDDEGGPSETVLILLDVISRHFCPK